MSLRQDSDRTRCYLRCAQPYCRFFLLNAECCPLAGSTVPQCSFPCSAERKCGHPCSYPCHEGDCPPCVVLMSKQCECGQTKVAGITCSRKVWRVLLPTFSAAPLCRLQSCARNVAPNCSGVAFTRAVSAATRVRAMSRSRSCALHRWKASAWPWFKPIRFRLMSAKPRLRPAVALAELVWRAEIGRASCRERV